ncbi:ribokinase [Agrilutibacter solisilvae]|uniref:Ribokinase n=1 Tax=Agrilutibacter solisilvae TaxID=2763317 RepID=A0A974Y1T2_9GAMM|nr:ribokinase [Lysobacter solisilvae]QSX79739.1 ribokinase [Lysobacter solisilvae]
MPTVLVIGSFNVDHVWRVAALPRPGETLGLGEYLAGPGGKGFNQATAVARAGARTHFVCALGEDVGAQLARALATADDIDLRDLRATRPTGTAGIFVDAQGRNIIVVAPGANAELDEDFVQTQGEAIGRAQVVLAQLESPTAAVARGFSLARQSGAVTVLNPAPADAEIPASLLRMADILTPNESEFAAQLLAHTGQTIDPAHLATQDESTLHSLCRDLLRDGTVVVTLGAAGCFVSHASDQRRGDVHLHYRVPAEPVTPVDTTGAGDAFNGALAASLARSPDAAFETHVRYANRYAALSTEQVGAATSMPQDAQVRSRFGD